ncbi:UDP-N-acetylglucosamine 2-epimerase (non-hydrolysing) [Prevotella aff. ruminicola Tc2-24]|uniref:UDP-N-acetylglucosamine 2-epimerase (Non-hydrolysing) n=1 Tax=Prevotella aff. ruminicola Tc2-24 TaxID=81582 RepID=A0A1I0MEI1_9BACT|nr:MULTISPECIES: UDP-N-acetylglucosamine 2-epimerase (non-hydrolyzing) [Prevotella]SEE10996.1 UDP-N-acetylglucosamine 2-epimerase (non-hydrolysing) [Prevotella sp. lc2012]SEV86783.1 UDP-N-acetylglucosamine 2-epimerase (non-hydrolysing) [Prevotella aff. ruminicola Tc2-24]
MAKRICIIAGARPNFVKVSPLVRAIERHPSAECMLIYAGRADDPTLEDSLFDDLQMPRPQYFLDVDSTSLNEITSRVMATFDRFLDEHPVDVVIVVDDLASTMAAAIVTKKRGIRLAHLVAGTRSFDINMPKEINRLVIDALSDDLFTAGVRSTGIATREQSENSQTYLVGNILMDTLRYNYDRFKKPVSLPDLSEGQYIVFTLNRRALIADKENLARMVHAMVAAAGDVPVIAPLRGNARKAVEEMNEKVRIVNPLSYLEFGWLTSHAKGVITDSGNVAEEATFNSVPCITLNNYTEHQETVTIGSNVLVGEDAEKLRESVGQMVKGEWKKCALPDRWDGRTAERIVQILV